MRGTPLDILNDLMAACDNPTAVTELGGDLYCFFCNEPADGTILQHAADCPWVHAKEYLDVLHEQSRDKP